MDNTLHTHIPVAGFERVISRGPVSSALSPAPSKWFNSDSIEQSFHWVLRCWNLQVIQMWINKDSVQSIKKLGYTESRHVNTCNSLSKIFLNKNSQDNSIRQIKVKLYDNTTFQVFFFFCYTAAALYSFNSLVKS